MIPYVSRVHTQFPAHTKFCKNTTTRHVKINELLFDRGGVALKVKTYQCSDLSQTQAAGGDIYQQLAAPACVYVHGTMGAGKTSLCQAIIHAAGYSGAVTSPTYNLIHEYPVAAGVIYHLDLYRLDDAAEIEYLGVKDLWQADSLFLVEWPLRGEGYLPKADFTISIERSSDSDANARTIEFRAGN